MLQSQPTDIKTLNMGLPSRAFQDKKGDTRLVLVLQGAEQQSVISDGQARFPLGIRIAVVQVNEALQLLHMQDRLDDREVLAGHYHCHSYEEPRCETMAKSFRQPSTWHMPLTF